MMGGKVAAEELSDGEAGLEAIIAKRAKKKKGEPSAKSRKIPYIQVNKQVYLHVARLSSNKLTIPSTPP